MATVEAGYAAALRAEYLVAEAVPLGSADWGERGRVMTVPTPFATPAGAAAEARRVAAFFGAPIAVDRVPVTGEARALKHRCIRLVARGLDYAEGGDLVFVLGVDELDNGTSVLTVVKRLL